VEAATKLSTGGAVLTVHLFGKDAAHAEATSDLVGE
jgi:hypothetical protein